MANNFHLINCQILENTISPLDQMQDSQPRAITADHSSISTNVLPTWSPQPFASTENNLSPRYQHGQNNSQPTNTQQQALNSATRPRKRAPKAPTISAKKWKLHENRLRQLYVHEGKSYKEVRDTLNKELGFAATEAQYKAQIKRMRLKRNVEKQEQEAIVLQIQQRAEMGKESHVRIHGHELSQKKKFDWLKRHGVSQANISTAPLPPIPDDVSIYTESIPSPRLTSNAILQSQVPTDEFTDTINAVTSFIQTLQKYAENPGHIVELQKARSILNDFQTILSSERTSYNGRHLGTSWKPDIDQDITQARNVMNSDSSQWALVVDREPTEPNTHQHSAKSQQRFPNHRHSAYHTPHGRLEVSFWSSPNETHSFGAKIAFLSNSNETFSSRIVLDLDSYLDPAVKITYQALRPNDSEVFAIVTSGDIRRLEQALANGTASLNDRDEEGRSLLNYAVQWSQPKMCKFLLANGADVNAIEPSISDIENIGPLFLPTLLDLGRRVERLWERADCTKVLLEADADLSLERYVNGLWSSDFIHAVAASSLISFKHILDYAEPFISLKEAYMGPGGECFPLTTLADWCGRSFTGMHINEKAILLLQRKAEISCRGYNGDTVLHTLLRHEPQRDKLSGQRYRYVSTEDHWSFSRGPKDLLRIFITAGADVYATNDEGETPSAIACQYGRGKEWLSALIDCGYDVAQIWTCCPHPPSVLRQTSKLSFEEYCRQRDEFCPCGCVEIDTDEESSDEDEDDSGSDEEEKSEERAHDEACENKDMEAKSDGNMDTICERVENVSSSMAYSDDTTMLWNSTENGSQYSYFACLNDNGTQDILGGDWHQAGDNETATEF